MPTKEKIIWESLTLFSTHGYTAVSVRDIARSVGIRESSLYNHFPNKRAIFDAIVDICWSKAEEYFHTRSLPFSSADDLSVFRQNGPALEQTVLSVFRYFFEDPWNQHFRRLLTICQFEDQRSAQLYRELYCLYPVSVQEKIFAELIACGLFRQCSPKALARQFYGGVFLLLSQGEPWETAEAQIREQIRQFYEAYKK